MESNHSDETAPFDDEIESEEEATLVAEALNELGRCEFFTHAEVRHMPRRGECDHVCL
jgi:hypothetical protein